MGWEHDWDILAILGRMRAPDIAQRGGRGRRLSLWRKHSTGYAPAYMGAIG